MVLTLSFFNMATKPLSKLPIHLGFPIKNHATLNKSRIASNVHFLSMGTIRQTLRRWVRSRSQTVVCDALNMEGWKLPQIWMRIMNAAPIINMRVCSVLSSAVNSEKVPIAATESAFVPSSCPEPKASIVMKNRAGSSRMKVPASRELLVLL